MANTRIEWIDYAKAIAILCVVLIHANVPYPAKGMIRVWVIPLFFFLSGIFANTQRYTTLREFLIQKGLPIIIPYLCFNIINYLFWLFLGRHYGYDADTPTLWWKPIVGIVYGSYPYLTHYRPLWFLACLFTTETLFYLLFRHLQRNKIYWIVVFIIGFIGCINASLNPITLPWGLGIAFPMMVFYAIGNFYSTQIRTNTYRFLKLRYAVPLLISSLCVIVVVYMSNPGEVLVFSNKYGNYILFYIGAFSGICFMTLLCRLLEQLSKYITWLSFIGRNTLIILCLHLNMFSIIKGFTYFICKLPLEIYTQTWLIVISSILNIVLLVPFILLINRYCPFITGHLNYNEGLS